MFIMMVPLPPDKETPATSFEAQKQEIQARLEQFLIFGEGACGYLVSDGEKYWWHFFSSTMPPPRTTCALHTLHDKKKKKERSYRKGRLTLRGKVTSPWRTPGSAVLNISWCNNKFGSRSSLLKVGAEKNQLSNKNKKSSLEQTLLLLISFSVCYQVCAEGWN